VNVKRLILILFPAPRRPVTFRRALPLIVFLALFVALCLFLDLRGILLFARPAALLLILVSPWVWWIHAQGLSGLTGMRGLVALLVRLCLVGVFVMLMAEPRAVRKSNILSVVYALDLSDSIGEGATDAALRYVTKTVAGKPQKDEAGLIVFGRDAAVEMPPRTVFPFEAVNSRIVKDATNLEKGLSLAGAMLSQENTGRIVLISDGTQTEGGLTSILDTLKSRDIAVDVLPIEYTYSDEVWLEKLELPREVKTGETYEASVILSSLKAGRGKLTLRENGRVIYEENVDYAAGKNRYVLPLYLREPGYYEYVATIECAPGKDGWRENNTAINYIFLQGEGKVLVVTDPAGDDRDWRHLVDSLKKAERLTETSTAYEFPRDALTLLPFDCVIFVNVPADAFDIVQFQALRDAVYSQGLGFLMVGGKNSFGPGGYNRTAVEEALPVTMDIHQRKVLPKGALVVILHTCEFPEGNTWGKRVAKEAVRVLGAQDEVGILVYDWNGGEKWLFKLTPAGQYERLVTLINQAEIGDMPSFENTMKMGLDALKASDAATKHMIIISDGDPAPPTPELVKQFIAEKVSISMVAIYPHGGQDISVMQSIAGATGGRYYFPQDPNQLPSIFIKEAKTLRRSMIQNKVFTPETEFPSPILKGIDALPELRGYVLTTPKPRSTTILKGPETEEMDPVLATWRFGLGKTAAFTSDLSPNWGAAWVGWDKYHAFVKQLITDISRTERTSDLRVQSFAEGNMGIVVVEDHHKEEAFLEVEAQAVSGQKVQKVRMQQVAPRRYQGEFPLWGKGRYQVVVGGMGAGRNERAVSGFVIPYSPEYLRFRSNPIVLAQIAEKTGGRLLTASEKGQDIFVKERKPHASSKSIIDWFLLVLACLIPLDVGVRRVQLDWYVIRGWLGIEGKGTSEKTLGALLERKKTIEFVPRGEKPRRPTVIEVRREAAPSLAEKTPVEREVKPVEPRTEPGEEARRSMSTTERLLATKKKWKKGEE